MANIADLPATAAARVPGEPALADTTSGTSFTWSELDAAINGQARALRGHGVGAGDRVLLRLPTSADFAVSLFAVARAGAIAVPVSPLAPEPEVRNVVEHSGARFTISREPGDVPPQAGPGSRSRRSATARTSPCCRTRRAPPARPAA